MNCGVYSAVYIAFPLNLLAYSERLLPLHRVRVEYLVCSVEGSRVAWTAASNFAFTGLGGQVPSALPLLEQWAVTCASLRTQFLLASTTGKGGDAGPRGLFICSGNSKQKAPQRERM